MIAFDCKAAFLEAFCAQKKPSIAGAARRVGISRATANRMIQKDPRLLIEIHRVRSEHDLAAKAKALADERERAQQRSERANEILAGQRERMAKARAARKRKRLPVGLQRSEFTIEDVKTALAKLARNGL